MGQKTIAFSDLSHELILDDDQLARLVVQEHPALANGPVQIEALASEVKTIEDDRLNVVVVDLYLPGQDEPERVYLDVKLFDALASDGDMANVLASAAALKRTRRGSVSSRPAGERVNYASSEHAGAPHRGRTTEEEKEYVRDHFDEVNERLRAQGHRIIDLRDAELVERYGLEVLARERSA